MTLNHPAADSELPGSEPGAIAKHLESRPGRASRQSASSRGVGFWEVTLLIVSLSTLACLLVLHFSPWSPMTTVKHYAAIPNCKCARFVGLASARRGGPGYWPWNDVNDDGISCDRWRGIRRLAVEPNEPVPVIQAGADSGDRPLTSLVAPAGPVADWQLRAD